MSKKEIQERLLEIRAEILNTVCWGARLSVLWEEQQNLLRELSALEEEEEAA